MCKRVTCYDTHTQAGMCSYVSWSHRLVHISNTYVSKGKQLFIKYVDAYTCVCVCSHGFLGGIVWVLSAPQRCNAQRSDAQRKFFTTLSISLFLQRHRCDALPCFLASPVEIFTSHTSPFGLCFQFSFRHNGLLYKTTRNWPRVTTQRCRHWQREMANANANANAAMRCTKYECILAFVCK